uniref:Ig-like domain-containing protein n=1 Tax=Dicentrarchus labrax TaxID=13489 RepID=A0A8P4KQX0_DICLA
MRTTDLVEVVRCESNCVQLPGEESVCLKCVGDGQTADGWTVKRTAGGHNEDFGRFDGSCYIISKLSQSDTGVYWCGTSSGQKSNQINITVTDYRGKLFCSLTLSVYGSGLMV